MKRATIPFLLLCLLFSAGTSAGVYHVDPAHGDDNASGDQTHAWRTIGHAMTQLAPGDTLNLRGGVYFENVFCAVVGTAEQPITIQSQPGERAVIDGSFSPFQLAPANAWIAVTDGTPGEYRSTQRFRNVHGVVGMFLNDAIPLNTYWQLPSLLTDNELGDMDPNLKILARPVYCGAGVWHDRQTGYIHARFAPTNNNSPLARDYRGPTDPRTMPLVIASLHSVPLTIDRAMHVRWRNVEIRGGGLDTIVLRNAMHVELDRIAVPCGSIRATGSGHVQLTNSTVSGRIPPWVWRADSSKGCASGNIADVVRLTVPVLLELSNPSSMSTMPRTVHNDWQAGRVEGRRAMDADSDDAAMPQMTHARAMNHDWVIAHCEFTNGHDGVFISGKNMRFHHNLVADTQDDAIDFSWSTPETDDDVSIHQNVFRRTVTVFSSHNWGVHRPRGNVSIYRNVIDLREPMAWMRPTGDKPQGVAREAMGFLMHGADAARHIESARIYHNTFVGRVINAYCFAHGTLNHVKPESTRRVFNNIFVYLEQEPRTFISRSLEGQDLLANANLHWRVGGDQRATEAAMRQWREHALSTQAYERSGMRWEADSVVADPGFIAFSIDPSASNDYRIKSDSSAAGRGMVLPDDWHDPLRPDNGAAPDIGALPVGGQPLRVGVDGRYLAGGTLVQK